MNKKSVERTQKISRHRKFLEDRAQADLRSRTKQTQHAQERLEESQSVLDVVSQWKNSPAAAGGLDLTLYQNALHFESVGLRAVEAAVSALDAAKSQQQDSAANHLAAMKGSRVANARLERIFEQSRLQQERLLSDQVSDLWLANKERKPS